MCTGQVQPAHVPFPGTGKAGDEPAAVLWYRWRQPSREAYSLDAGHDLAAYRPRNASVGTLFPLVPSGPGTKPGGYQACSDDWAVVPLASPACSKVITQRSLGRDGSTWIPASVQPSDSITEVERSWIC